MFAIHISHFEEDDTERVVGPFETREDAEAFLDASDSWERDERPQYAATVWHTRDAEARYLTAVVVEVEPPTALRTKRAKTPR